ncbi:MAG: Ig-like domain-containing protein [Planctomycetota bacterium]
MAAAVLLLGCSGGGEQASPQQVLFTVTAVTPLDASQDVPLTEQINVVFSKAVDAGTVDGDSFEVAAETGEVIRGSRVVPQLNQSLVRFVPDQGYMPLAVHTIRITREVKDQEGTPLDRTYEFRFQTEEEGPALPTQDQVENLGDLLKVGRFFHRMTLLPTLRRFIVAGGYLVDGNIALGTAENLIPVLQQSTILPSSLRGARAAHVQVLLQDGRILLAGGEISSSPFIPLATCEIFDPDGFRFEAAPSMHFARSLAHATVLPDGRVLVTGGQGVNAAGEVVFRDDAEIYDPIDDAWTLLGSRMEAGRSAHFSALVPGGDVVIVGGTLGPPSATFWRAATQTFSSQLGTPFHEHFFGAGTVLPDGRPFVAGGLNTTGVTLLDPQFGFLQAVNRMPTERVFATATAFVDGRVLVVGGFDLTAAPPTIHDSLDVFLPDGATGRIFRAPDIQLPRPTSHHAAARGPDGAVWITGGLPLLTTLPALKQVVVIHPD